MKSIKDFFSDFKNEFGTYLVNKVSNPPSFILKRKINYIYKSGVNSSGLLYQSIDYLIDYSLADNIHENYNWFLGFTSFNPTENIIDL